MIRKRFFVLILYPLFWYLLFVLARIIFLLSYYNKTIQIPFSEALSTFFYGFRLDFAIASYISILPSLMLILTSFTKVKYAKYFYPAYTFIALLLCTTIIAGDLFMYKHWGFRLDATPLFYMTNMKALTASASMLIILTGIIAVLLVTCVHYIIFNKLFHPQLDSLPRNPKAGIIMLLSFSLLIIGLRGGVGISSLTTSSAYFSQNHFANHAAINPVWNVGFSITESDDLQKKYVYFSENRMHEILSSLSVDNSTALKLLKHNRPNILLIITESLTSKAIEAGGGRPDIMPELNQLIKEGILFDQVYASSDRTDKGIAAVLAGYPSLPGSSPLKYQKLTQKLTFLPAKLNAAGYRSEFYYGGTLDFANYRSFLVQAGFNKMVSDKDYPLADLKSKWGAFDQIVFNRCIADSPDTDSMFFKTILTLTSHEPFEIPVKPVFEGNDDETKFLNSLHYTDAMIGNFVREAKTRKWWKNTLVIIIADHGSRLPGNSGIEEKSKYHIPMIWLGGALNVRDTVIGRIASQTDLTATLLSQLQIRADEFKFSKNILASSYVPYSFFTFSNGFGFMTPDNLMIYNTITNEYTDGIINTDSTPGNQGKAYLQSAFMDLQNKNK